MAESMYQELLNEHIDEDVVVDTDPSFTINTITKEISSNGVKRELAQYDHNSERITFECDRFIEGHDVMLCNAIRVHYAVPGGNGVYDVLDAVVPEEDDSIVRFTWLVSSNVTQFTGTIYFTISFECVQEDGTITYLWNTKPNDELECVEAIRNSDSVVPEYVDTLEQWRQQLFEASDDGVTNIVEASQEQQQAIEDKGEEVRASIPEEYTALSDNVVVNTANISNLTKRVDNIAIFCEVTGDSVYASGTSNEPLSGLTVFGKSAQDGIPTPDAPVEITSTSDSGSITVTVSDGSENSQTLTIPTSIGLYGLPVDSGGNYTDDNGQQWICDEIDLTRGVKIQRVYVLDCVKDSFSISKHSQSSDSFFVANALTAACNSKSILSTHFESSSGFTKEGIYVYAIGDGTRPLHISISTARGVTTTEEAKQWLIDNGVKVLHVLKNPVEIPLTDEQKADYSALMSYFPTTTATNDKGAGLKLSYIADTKLYIDSRISAMLASANE